VSQRGPQRGSLTLTKTTEAAPWVTSWAKVSPLQGTRLAAQFVFTSTISTASITAKLQGTLSTASTAAVTLVTRSSTQFDQINSTKSDIVGYLRLSSTKLSTGDIKAVTVKFAGIP